MKHSVRKHNRDAKKSNKQKKIQVALHELDNSKLYPDLKALYLYRV